MKNPTIQHALRMSGFWIALAALINLGVYFVRGKEDALNFLAGYLVEKSLSVDNLFVFFVIFSSFKVPAALLNKVLFWGVWGAVVLRAIFIFFGIQIVTHFHWVFYFLGAFLIITGLKLAFTSKEKPKDFKTNFLFRQLQRLIPVTESYEGDKFFIRRGGKILATPLFITLLAVETTDVLFAIDSIPAIFGITTDPFIVYTSNILAILGLRSLYFVLASFIDLFRYLHYGLAAILVFIGAKMLLTDYVTIPIHVSLGVVVGMLVISMVFSRIKSTR